MSAVQAPLTAPPTNNLLKSSLKILKHTLEESLNWFFSLGSQAGKMRLLVRELLFALLWVYWTASLHNLETWRALLLPLRDAFLIFNLQQVIIEGGILAFSSFLSAGVLRHLLMLVAPYLLAREMAAIYLADIFEKESKTARAFLLRAAFGEAYTTIRITEGKILADHQGSTIVQIGGPGYVSVDLDSAVLFERPDGSARVIGPSSAPKAPATTDGTQRRARADPSRPKKNRVTLDAFERIRQCVDLRTINGSQTVVARSRDGIPVTARDVQYTFSIFRGQAAQPCLQNPYPFDPEAITKMVYNPPRPVKMGGSPDTRSDWIKPMPGGIVGNIASALGEFISQRSLTEFFSAIGKPEEDALAQRATGVQNAALSLAGLSTENSADAPLQAPAFFTSRSSLSEQLLSKLQKQLPNGGKQIHWLGVGTWDTPAAIIPANHIEAWKISQESRRLRSKDNLEKLYKDANQNELSALIREMPLEAYARLDDAVRAGQMSEEELIDSLLKAYHQRLLDAQKYQNEHGEPSSRLITAALEMLNLLRFRQVGNDYFIGYNLSSRLSEQVAGATAYRLDLVFASTRLSGYEMAPVNFDFLAQPSLPFQFEVNASRGIVSPNTLQSTLMRCDDLFVQTSFEVTLLPGDVCDADLIFEQEATRLGDFFIQLPPPA